MHETEWGLQKEKSAPAREVRGASQHGTAQARERSRRSSTKQGGEGHSGEEWHVQRPRDAGQWGTGTPGGMAQVWLTAGQGQLPEGSGSHAEDSRLYFKDSKELLKVFRQGQGQMCVSVGFLGSNVSGMG